MRLPLIATLLATAALPATAQELSKPQPVPFDNRIPEPRDVPFRGTVKLDVDATDTVQGIFRVKETITGVTPGPMTLLYPKWLPGAHSPRGEIEKLAGLIIRANGKRLEWTRDPVDVFAFHIDVPTGAKQLDIELQFLSATKSDQGRVVVTPNMMSVQFNSMSLYPAGYFTRQIPVALTATYPAGWTAVSALPAKKAGSTYTYAPTNYEVLVDSPAVAGRYYKEWALTPRVDFNVWAESQADLDAARPEHIAALSRTAEQAIKLFGSQHYDHYEFLHTLSGTLGPIGLEHHRSTEIGRKSNYFRDWATTPMARNVMPHEFVHSWDGKFRRGADLWTPNFNVPMRDSLLWVYEGQTQFWGYVLQARGGLVSKEDTLAGLANIAATYDTNRARDWRSLIDTTNDPIISARKPKGWTSWQRSEDYYSEGLLVWLDVDSLIREKTGGRKSIDDFALAFFGMRDGDWGQLTYTFDDVVATLNGVVPSDWATFLRQRLTENAKGAPLDGLTRNGYRLVYRETPTTWFAQNEKYNETAYFDYSVGLQVKKAGEVGAVTWGGPAFKVGMKVGQTIVAVNGTAYSDERLRTAITEAKTGDPIRLLVKTGDRIEDLQIVYRGGNRYPALEKVGKGETGLDRLLAPR
jgi:predicted metalloprotease with PDZ domain